MHAYFSLLFLFASQIATLNAEQSGSYLLKTELSPDSTTQVIAELEVGGEMLVSTEKEVKELPLKVLGHFSYKEKIIAWDADPEKLARSIRQYDRAEAHIEVAEQSSDRKLPTDESLVLAEIRGW